MEQPKSIEELKLEFIQVPESDLLLELFDELAVPSSLESRPGGGYSLRARAQFGRLVVAQNLDQKLVADLNQKLLYAFLAGNHNAGLYLNLAELKPFEEIKDKPFVAGRWNFDMDNYNLISSWGASRFNWDGTNLMLGGGEDRTTEWGFMILPARAQRSNYSLRNLLPGLPNYQVAIDFLLHGELGLLSLRKYSLRPKVVSPSANDIRGRYNLG